MATDLKNNITVVQSLAPASQADPSVPVNGTGVDRNGYDGVCAVINTGTISGAGASLTFEVQHSDDNSAFTAVADDDLDGTEPVITASNDVAVYEVGYRGIKRYVRVSITAKAGTTPTLICDASFVLSKSRKKPA
jgi:hypothetical protein